MEGRLGMLAVVMGMLLWQSPACGATLPKPTHTSKTRFRIPFKFDAAALKRMNAREIQLHVSYNQGETWERAQVLAPDGGKFEYVAATEGEYWFAVKTLDGQNQLHPPRGSYETGLIVVVDTTTPQLDLSLQQVAAGKVQVRWRASDSQLDIETLRLEYLAPGARDWTFIDVAPRARGETAWMVGQTGIVSVRGRISDLAGNTANTKVQMEVDAENYPALKQRPIPQGKIATIPVDDDTGRARVDSSISMLPIPEPDDDEPGFSERNGRTPNLSRPIDQYAMKPSLSGSDVGRSAIPATPVSRDSVAANHAGSGSLTGRSTQYPSETGSFRTDDATASTRAVSSRKKYVTSHRFQLGYKLEDVGPSGVAAVELFITEDNGGKWWKYGDDPDLKSPIDVEVPRDGECGFAIRVRSGAGLSNDPPAPGEPPAMVVAVDQTAPIVELLPIQQGQGANFNRVLIRWRVAEDHPSDKSVSLYYAASRSGPWEPISGWREDRNSEFEWRVGPGVPLQFYIRVMVRDAAGNVGKAETPQPIVVDLSKPSAQILDVEMPRGSGPR